MYYILIVICPFTALSTDTLQNIFAATVVMGFFLPHGGKYDISWLESHKECFDLKTMVLQCSTAYIALVYHFNSAVCSWLCMVILQQQG